MSSLNRRVQRAIDKKALREKMAKITKDALTELIKDRYGETVPLNPNEPSGAQQTPLRLIYAALDVVLPNDEAERGACSRLGNKIQAVADGKEESADLSGEEMNLITKRAAKIMGGTLYAALCAVIDPAILERK